MFAKKLAIIKDELEIRVSQNPVKLWKDGPFNGRDGRMKKNEENWVTLLGWISLQLTFGSKIGS